MVSFTSIKGTLQHNLLLLLQTVSDRFIGNIWPGLRARFPSKTAARIRHILQLTEIRTAMVLGLTRVLISTVTKLSSNCNSIILLFPVFVYLDEYRQRQLQCLVEICNEARTDSETDLYRIS